MVAEDNQNLQLVPFVATNNQDQICIDEKQVLSASFLMKINQNYAPLYRFVQQPMGLLMPFNLMNRNQLSDPNKPEHINRLAIIPSSHEEVPAEIMNNEMVVWQGEAAAGHEFEITNAPKVCELPFSDRKKNWITRLLPRSKTNTWDAYHVHLQTDVQFKSMVLAHKFIVHGIFPARRVTGKKAEKATKPSAKASPNRATGKKLLTQVPVGYYNHSTKEILRGETPPPGARGAKCHTGNKRKRKSKTSAQEETEEIGTAQETAQLTYILYDFEPVQTY